MTGGSNPGREKSVNDPVRFKGKTTHEEVEAKRFVDPGGVVHEGSIVDSVLEGTTNTTYVKDDETLNEALDRSDGDDVKLVLPAGGTVFDERIGDREGLLIIEGQGVDSTSLVAENELLYYDFGETDDKTLILKDLTLDGNNLESQGSYILLRGESGINLLLKDVKVVDINLADHTNNALGFVSTRGTIDTVVLDGVEFRADTFSNMTGDKYHVVRDTSGDVIKRLVSTERSHYVGRAWQGTSDPQAITGFRCRVSERAIVNGTFEEWDQWATGIGLVGDDPFIVCRASTRMVGDGDQFWFYSSVGNGTIVFKGSAHGAFGQGDRVFVLGGSSHAGIDHLMLDTTCTDVYVPVEINGADVVTGNISILDCGHQTDTAGRHGVYIRDRDYGYEQINLRVNVRNRPDSGRYMDPGVGLREPNGTWDDNGLFLVEGQISGAEVDAFSDSTDTGTTVNTDRLFTDD